jgi:glycosyltransferase involved in cell wall biosynthesis
MPAYNAARFVGRALASVQAQTLSDFELIVVDDGSTDETPVIVGDAAARDPRIRLIRRPNGGVAAARNRALAEARGAYVANLDADDLWRPAFLQRCVEALEQASAAPFAFARSLWIDAEDGLLDQTEQPLPARLDYRLLLLRNPVGNGSAAVMRTELVRALGGYDEDLVRRFGQVEDWMLLLRLSWLGDAAVVGESLVLYRVDPQSSSHALERMARAGLEVIRRCRAEGPRLAAHDYWSAKSLMLLWITRRARRMGRWGLAGRLAAATYLSHPLWFTLPELRRPLRMRRRRPAAPLTAAGRPSRS